MGYVSLEGGGGKVQIRGRRGGMGDPIWPEGIARCYPSWSVAVRGAVWGQQQLLVPEAWLLCPLFSQETCLQQGGCVQ